MAKIAADIDRLEMIVALIDHIDRRLTTMTIERFEVDADEIDLTAFRLSHIGENARKLSQLIKDRHPSLPWRQMGDMRNLIAHEYGRIAPDRIWRTAATQLAELRNVCGAELHRLRS